MDELKIENPLSHKDSTAYESLDLWGLRYPHLLISVIKAIRSLKPNQELQIHATDLNAPSSITARSRQSGIELLDMVQEGNCFVSLLKQQPEKVEALDLIPATQVQKEAGRTLTADS